MDVSQAWRSPLEFVPLRLSVYRPEGVEEFVPTVRVASVAENTGCGLNSADALYGIPRTVSVMGVEAFPMGTPIPTV